MGDRSAIQWTNATWNPVRGCFPVSSGCSRCYAAGIAARFSGPGLAYEGLGRFSPKRRLPQFTGAVRFLPDRLALPLRWRKPRRIFVTSTSDLFHDGFTNEQIAAVFGVMAATPWHIYQLLTKRPERAFNWFRWVERSYGRNSLPWKSSLVTAWARKFLGDKMPGDPRHGHHWPLPNVHLGVSVENQEAADERIPILLETPAAVRFISAEPLLEALDLRKWIGGPDGFGGSCERCGILWREHVEHDDIPSRYCPPGFQPGLDWVIVGGESGPRARPFDLEWARRIVADCKHAGVPVFVKQLGSQPLFPRVPLVEIDRSTLRGRSVCEEGTVVRKLRSRSGGDPAEWPEDLRVREFPRARCP